MTRKLLKEAGNYIDQPITILFKAIVILIRRMTSRFFVSPQSEVFSNEHSRGLRWAISRTSTRRRHISLLGEFDFIEQELGPTFKAASIRRILGPEGNCTFE